jgi:hypothetical protein
MPATLNPDTERQIETVDLDRPAGEKGERT